ncbi:unnamed protein product [Symbiodinium natans]|uniref:Uncharacterized protein n=1 Tax=Symbiodinium natans TaxID=878477 RepID=A0A812R620_9DINO|nr:unnamed protein product [Symbiodinium natans]
MVRGRGHAEFILPPIEKATMTSTDPRHKASKASLPPIPSMPSTFTEADSSERQRSARPARFRPAADFRNGEAAETAPPPQPPPQQLKGRARPHPYLLDASLKGFCWRTSFEKIRPSAEKADKVYFAPVVPGVPCPRKGRRPRRQNGGLLPLPTYTVQPPISAPASPSAPRQKVLSKLHTVLALEGLPEDVARRVIDAVEEVFDEQEAEQELRPAPKVYEFCNDASPTTEDESPSAPTEVPIGELSDSFIEAAMDQATVSNEAPEPEAPEPEAPEPKAPEPKAPEPKAPEPKAPEPKVEEIRVVPNTDELDEARSRMNACLRAAVEAERAEEAVAQQDAAVDEAHLRTEANPAAEDGALQEAAPSLAAAETHVPESEEPEDSEIELASDDEFEVIDMMAAEVLTSVFSRAVGAEAEPEPCRQKAPGEQGGRSAVTEGKLEFNATTNKWVRRPSH